MAVASRLQHVVDTAANWAANNPILLAGEAGYVSDNGRFKLGDGATAWNSLNYATRPVEVTKSLCLLEPTATEDISMYFQKLAAVITRVEVVLVGSSTPSVTWTIRHGSDRNAVGTALVTAGTTTTTTTTVQTITTFDAASISAGSHVWFETTAKSGTVNSINLTITYRE